MQGQSDRIKLSEALEKERAREQRWLAKHEAPTQLVKFQRKSLKEVEKAAAVEASYAGREKAAAGTRNLPHQIEINKAAKVSASIANKMMQQAAIEQKKLATWESRQSELGEGKSAQVEVSRDKLETALTAQAKKEADHIEADNESRDEKEIKNQVSLKRAKFKHSQAAITAHPTGRSLEQHVSKVLKRMSLEASRVEEKQQTVWQEAENTLKMTNVMQAQVSKKMTATAADIRNTEAMLQQLKNNRALRLLSESTL